MLEFQYIERGLLVFSANWILPCDESMKKLIFRIKPVYMYSHSEIALIHDTRHVRTRFRVDGIKARHLPIGLIAVEFVCTVKRVRRFYSCKMSSSSCDKFLRHFLIALRTSTVTSASRKEAIVPSSHYLSLSSLKWNVLRFLFSRMNKLDRDFLPSVLRPCARFQTLRNNSQQHATTCNRLCKQRNM